jgi:hypothetical protein
MSKNKKTNGWFLLIVGILIISFATGVGSGRQSQPEFDGDKDAFSIQILDKDDKAEEGDIYSVILRVKNTESDPGSMYVQCSILDEDEHTWLEDVLLQATVWMTTEENCVADEPFTQTAYVSIDGDATENLGFTIQVPELSNKETAVVYCSAFEQCYQESPYKDPYASSSIKSRITVVEDDEDDSNNNYVTEGESCESKTDCSGWLLGDVECVNGKCVDVEDVPDEPFDLDIEWPDLTDTKIKEWASGHEILIWGSGFLMLIIGAMIVFRTPKRQY